MNSRVIKSVFIVYFFLCLVGCKNKGNYVFESERNSFDMEFCKNGEYHKWFCFTKDGFDQVEKPEFAPVITKGAWTECIRISSANVTANSKNSVGYAVVNRLGILSFEGEKAVLVKDTGVFENRTAGNLMFVDETPVFTVNKSAFFNDTISLSDYKKDNSRHLFLLQYDLNTKVSYPLVNCTNLLDIKEAEVSDVFWNGNKWFCSIKYLEDGRTKFDYVTWRPSASLLSVTPSNAKENLVIEEISPEQFRNARQIFSFDKAPDKVKKLLKNFSSKKPFYLELKTAGGAGSLEYENMISENGCELKAKGIISKELTSVLFEDGTMYLQGNLPEKGFINGGKTLALRLPKLPDGFVYSDYVITANTLFAAWEETAFYETERSGFIAVNLEKILY